MLSIMITKGVGERKSFVGQTAEHSDIYGLRERNCFSFKLSCLKVRKSRRRFIALQLARLLCVSLSCTSVTLPIWEMEEAQKSRPGKFISWRDLIITNAKVHCYVLKMILQSLKSGTDGCCFCGGTFLWHTAKGQ